MKRTVAMRAAALAATTLLTVAGCSGAGAAPATPGSHPSAIRIVEEHAADLHLWVSNQSFEDDPVILTVSIDGSEVVAQTFKVEDQHNWILFPIKVPPGRHVLDVVSATGVKMQKPFTLPETGRRYAAVDYWRNHPDNGGGGIAWHIQSTPLGFA